MLIYMLYKTYIIFIIYTCIYIYIYHLTNHTGKFLTFDIKTMLFYIFLF